MDASEPHPLYWDSLLETQIAIVRIANVYPYADLDNALLSRLAYLISVILFSNICLPMRSYAYYSRMLPYTTSQITHP